MDTIVSISAFLLMAFFGLVVGATIVLAVGGDSVEPDRRVRQELIGIGRIGTVIAVLIYIVCIDALR